VLPFGRRGTIYRARHRFLALCCPFDSQRRPPPVECGGLPPLFFREACFAAGRFVARSLPSGHVHERRSKLRRKQRCQGTALHRPRALRAAVAIPRNEFRRLRDKENRRRLGTFLSCVEARAFRPAKSRPNFLGALAPVLRCGVAFLRRGTIYRARHRFLALCCPFDSQRRPPPCGVRWVAAAVLPRSLLRGTGVPGLRLPILAARQIGTASRIAVLCPTSITRSRRHPAPASNC